MISYSGIKYSLTEGHPPIKDAVYGLSRLCRWNGQTHRWWPVLAHSHIVADLLRSEGPELELAGLIHDIPEGLGLGDISSDLKTQDQKYVETRLFERIVLGHYVGGLRIDIHHHKVKAADEAAASAERFLMLDGGSFAEDTAAVVLTARYVAERRYSDSEYLDYDGRPVRDYLKRLEDLVDDVHALSKRSPRSVQRSCMASAPSGVVASGRPSTFGRVVVQGIDGETIEGSSVGGVPGGSVLWCSGCGTEYIKGQAHVCSNDSWGYVGPQPGY